MKFYKLIENDQKLSRMKADIKILEKCMKHGSDIWLLAPLFFDGLLKVKPIEPLRSVDRLLPVVFWKCFS